MTAVELKVLPQALATSDAASAAIWTVLGAVAIKLIDLYVKKSKRVETSDQELRRSEITDAIEIRRELWAENRRLNEKSNEQQGEIIVLREKIIRLEQQIASMNLEILRLKGNEA
jgi:hypothetical protein